MMTISFDMRQFNATLSKAVAESSRAAPDVINGHAFAVAVAAIKLTEKAEINAMTQILSAPATQTKTGRLKKKSGQQGSFAAAIVNARRRNYAGADFMLHGHALDEAARKMINARRSASAFIKSGWIWALRDLLPFIKSKRAYPAKDIKVVGKPKGRAVAARPGAGVFGSGMFKTIIENTALIASGGKFQSKGAHNPLPIAEKGLALALQSEQANMEKHLAEKMKEAMRKAGAL